MNTYELTILFAEEKDGKEKERVLKLVTDFVKKHKGEVHKQDSWGAKHLAYPIQKHEIAIYEFFLISIDPAAEPELDRALRLDESVLRYLFVRV